MTIQYSFKIFDKILSLPNEWDALAVSNLFLSKSYLEVLEKSAPENMICHYIGLFDNEKLIGIALSQFLNLNTLTSYGNRDRCLKSSVRNMVFKNLSSHILIIGNNMLTGQNAFILCEKENNCEALKTLNQAAKSLENIFKAKGTKVHIRIFKDFSSSETNLFSNLEFKKEYQFSSQPNMFFEIIPQWKTIEDYTTALSKKYRDQYKRCRKKAEGIVKKQMSLKDILEQEELIYDLYYYVAVNAPFNTFFLSKNHFSTFKRIMGEKLLFYGYFFEEKLIGFNTLIVNGTTIDTYFLGYDESIQREKMLYLNMLYDMIAYSIKNNFNKITFARTALEIKSSIGAKPQEMFVFASHTNPVANLIFDKAYKYLEPKVVWTARNPFKTIE